MKRKENKERKREVRWNTKKWEQRR